MKRDDIVKLIMSHRDYIERFFIVRVKGDETLCRELVSEAYFNILTHYDTLREGATAMQRRNFVWWRCRDTWSRHRRNASLHDALPIEEHPDEPLSDEESNERLRESIEKLVESEKNGVVYVPIKRLCYEYYTKRQITISEKTPISLEFLKSVLSNL